MSLRSGRVPEARRPVVVVGSIVDGIGGNGSLVARSRRASREQRTGSKIISCWPDWVTRGLSRLLLSR